jgi:hypothetical protein
MHRMRPRTSATEVTRDIRPEPRYPTTNCLVRDLDAALRQQILDVSKAECEVTIKPNCVLNDRASKMAVKV